MRMPRLAVIVTFIAPLAACVSGSDSVTPSPNPNSGFQAEFAPLGGIMPFPNDLYFNGSTTGALNIPVLDPTQPANASILALNHLDGFGTQSNINVYFTSPVDATTLATGVFVLQVTSNPATKALSGFTKALVPGADYSIGTSAAIDGNGSVVNITPLKPLAGGTTYLVVVTTAVKDKNGNPATPSADYAAILAADAPALAAKDVTKINGAALPTVGLLPVAQFTFAQLAVGIPVIQGATANPAFGPGNIAVTFSFSTQFIGASLGTVEATATATTQPAGVGIADTTLTVCAVLMASHQISSCSQAPGSSVVEVFAGTVAIPYYSAVPTASNPTAPLTGFWHNAAGGDTLISTNPLVSELPAATVAQNVIPILVAIPTAGSGCTLSAPLSVVIFQHGITRNREDMLAVASTLAVGGAPSVCHAVVAIDLPLHGVTNKSDPFYTPGHERTFDLDVLNNTTLAPGPDGQIDPSGSSFINLTSTLTSRDNVREGAADLIDLTATLPNLHPFSGPPTAPTAVYAFDSTKVFYVGHSLGGIVGTTFLGADAASPKIKAAFLANPGGNLTQLLTTSVSFAPVINGGLASNGVVTNSQFYFDFLRNAQAAVDDGDPANYAAAAAATHPIDMIEVVGGFAGGADPCQIPDTVVPNSATDLLVSLMGLTQVNTTQGPGATPLHTVVKFLAGDHGSILSPVPPTTACNADAATFLNVTTEMQTEMGNFIGSGGVYLPINNSASIIK
jgi:pimeloyl-ACP methyl ester carboxylesterase